MSDGFDTAQRDKNRVIESSVAGLEVISRRAAAPAGRPPLLFIHGAFSGAWCWDEHFLPWFAARGYDAHAMSLRGHGDSDGRDRLDDSSIADFVDDVDEVVCGFSVPPVLIGHSMGGFIVQKFLERAQSAGAVLMASVPPRGLAGPGLSLAVWNPAAAFNLSSIQSFGEALGSPAVMQDALFSRALGSAQALGHLARMGPESTRAMLDMYGGDLVNPAQISPCPMLVMGAAEDELIPSIFVRATARSYDVPLRIFDDIGHLMMLDAAWEAVASGLLEWMEQNGF